MIENIYLFCALIAALMLLDYFLTLKGLKLYKEGYAAFVKVESYELNPIFRQSIKSGVYNPKHLLAIVLVIGSILLLNILFNNDFLILLPFVEGIIFMGLIFVNSRHIRNILTFRLIKKRPDLLTGSIEQKLRFGAYNWTIELFAQLLILLFLFAMMPGLFLAGCCLSLLIGMLQSMLWTRRYSRTEVPRPPLVN